jgi:hypothetical protein
VRSVRRLQGWISRLVGRREPNVVVLTVVPNEAIAGMICSMLASEGIEAAQKSATGALPYGGVDERRIHASRHACLPLTYPRGNQIVASSDNTNAIFAGFSLSRLPDSNRGPLITREGVVASLSGVQSVWWQD